jgi:molybdopterin molybdotransferase
VKTFAQIAAELQGYDPQALSASAVNEFLALMVEPIVETEQLGLFAALGRVLAANVISAVNVPPHDNSAMDGFAFAGAELAAHLQNNQPQAGSAATAPPLQLKVVGTAFAGQAWQGKVKPGECLKIMTGAVLPAGLNTVVPQEFVQLQADRISFPAHLLQAGDNRRALGEDIRAGQSALQKGELLTPAALGLVASLGIGSVTVWRKLRVAYFSTGDEILSLGEVPREGAVYDSNRYTVFGLLTRMGIEVIDLGVVRDDPALLEAAFIQAAAQADAIITSGGVSVGEADHTKAMMKQLAGADDSLGGVAFWRIAMRPGRPMAVGRLHRDGNGCFGENNSHKAHAASAASYQNNSKLEPEKYAILFGLPGNPVAVMVTFLAFVRPALRKMMGCNQPALPYLKAISDAPIRKKPGRTEYQRGVVSTAADGSLHVNITGNQGSGVLSSMTQANGLIVLHHHQASVAAGTLVDVMMFDGFS